MEFQDFVCVELAKRSGVIVQNLGSKRYQLAIGENIQGFEIKLDTLFLKTGRLSIECAEKSKASNPEWVASGIYRNDNTWLYIQGNYEMFFVFQKNLLQAWRRKHQPEIHEKHGTIQTFYLSLESARKMAALIVQIEAA